jgi:hypothetical protein
MAAHAGVEATETAPNNWLRKVEGLQAPSTVDLGVAWAEMQADTVVLLF